MEEKIILPESREAAELVTIECWKTPQGEYFMSEKSARREGHTHRKCLSCEKIFKKRGYDITTCEECFSENSERLQAEIYNKMPFKEWDGETPLYSRAFEEYFYSEDCISDFIASHDKNIKSDDLRLIICEPSKPNEIDPDNHWEDIYPEGHSFSEVASENLKTAIQNLNQVISEEKPWSWFPGKFRTDL